MVAIFNEQQYAQDFIAYEKTISDKQFEIEKVDITKGNGDKLLDILLTASKKLKRSLAPTGNLYR